MKGNELTAIQKTLLCSLVICLYKIYDGRDAAKDTRWRHHYQIPKPTKFDQFIRKRMFEENPCHVFLYPS